LAVPRRRCPLFSGDGSIGQHQAPQSSPMPSSTTENSIYHTVDNGLQGSGIEVLAPWHEKYPAIIVRWSEAAEKRAVRPPITLYVSRSPITVGCRTPHEHK
jgi:hypothetical protein